MSSRPELSEEFCPHGMVRGLPCTACKHQEGMKERNADQRLESIRGEKRSGEFVYDWNLEKGEERETSELGQDMFLVDEKRKLTAVFDGLGGEGDPESGARASALAANFYPNYMMKQQNMLEKKLLQKILIKCCRIK